MPHAVVVGGGLTGLTVAFRLKQLSPDTTVTVLEPRDRPGGNVVTEDHRGFRVECGPNGFLDRTPAVPHLVRDLGLSDRLIAASDGSRKNRYVFVGDKLHKLPSGPLGLLTTPLLTRSGKWKLLTEPWRKSAPPGTDESVQEFAARRVGKEAADVFADALVTGIHGGDPALLSVAAAFPRLPVMERDAGSVVRGFMRAAKKRKRDARARGESAPGPMKMWSFREGLGVLIDGLCKHLGDSVRCGVEVQTITETASVAPWQVSDQTGYSWAADAVVLACPAYEQAVILEDLNSQLAGEVGAIPYNRIAVVALGYRAEHCPGEHDGFGYIAPQNTRRDVLGVQWCSSIFPERAPQGFVLWRALCGGVHRAEQVEWDDDRLVRAVHDEIRRAMGVTGEPVFHRIVRWPNAIPQYVIGHLDRVARIDDLAAKHPGLFLTGNAYRGVAMADCVEQAEATAVRVAMHLQQGEA
ncbi:protoporphyrinogen oxidase : Protoporphyrinogen oxidase OS=Geobacter metallireducens (strain GS-15 / ATCC 53774 / DSM 7210) GN=hemY PE=4 SV=2: Amino_oxidase [Gemmata massiliana]|uniref:Coproporphyrinogen III oxidase n=1 Tax=Gemmata massiliana TaxID=1210884 RepID=A0A6P2DGW0_9BACT|nr:protoporphyrinogen oxidase [Gemmata massiliana]VTS00869.1 protoporphyrinogen oxidase : Protoporphyrinogen oxidase OS=Geobacter metallireducens (strain GS-15 / ATCC 53774 / DSM 7210) GN=hemY PE=4 SV=2: Amino_oxidase [Gemmata massiliana]